jgi:hypothetical protein
VPIVYRIEPDVGLVILVHTGVVPDDEFLSSYRTLFGDPQYQKSFNMLVDLRRADSSARSPDTLRQLAEFVRQLFGDAEEGPKVAVVAPEDISFGLARMYEALSDTVPWDFKVFRDVKVALPWLGLSEDLAGSFEQDGTLHDPTDSR